MTTSSVTEAQVRAATLSMGDSVRRRTGKNIIDISALEDDVRTALNAAASAAAAQNETT
jgi:hypothetical protein